MAESAAAEGLLDLVGPLDGSKAILVERKKDAYRGYQLAREVATVNGWVAEEGLVLRVLERLGVDVGGWLGLEVPPPSLSCTVSCGIATWSGGW